MDPSLAATIAAGVAGMFGFTVREVTSAIASIRRQRRGRKIAELISRADGRIAEGYVTKLLNAFYTIDSVEKGKLETYTLDVNGATLDTTIVSRGAWMDLEIALTEPTEQCELVKATPVDYKLGLRDLAPLAELLEERRLNIWDSTVYRLVAVEIRKDRLAAQFATQAFFDYRFGLGLLLEELLIVLGGQSFTMDRPGKLLPARSQLLPDGERLVRFSERTCVGGTPVLFAMAGQGDFKIPIQRRASEVSDANNLLSVIPKAFHQPMVDSRAEVALSSTVWREVFEELFGGKEAEKDVKRVRHDWYLSECEPLRWLQENKHAWRMECVAFGINLVSGNFEFAVVLCVEDSSFWDERGGQLETNWEAAGIEMVSSADEERLSQLLRQPDWAGEGLFTFVEGLRWLGAVHPTKVNLPELRRVGPSKHRPV